jgi:N-methylhydantoinase A
VIERIGPGGVVQTALDEASVHDAADVCRRVGVEAVAICLMHAFANPAHEQRIAAILRAALPGISVTASSDVLPVVREYERSLATVWNAVVMPGVATYVARLQKRLVAEGVAVPLLLMQSNGGVSGAPSIRRAPLLTALSGPAAGVVGARALAAACWIDNLITVDSGGTGADICLIKDGRIALTQQGHIGDWPLPLPMVDMVTIGTGGGSIAKVVAGTLSVGPQSAGAEPGPAAYGRGGTAATVTDAHVVLGNLPQALLGGCITLDTVATPLGLSVEAAARGILAISSTTI